MCIACASRNTVTSFLDMTSKKAPALKLKRRCFRVHRLLPLIGFHQQGEPYCSPIGLSFPTCIFTLFCCTIHVICFLNVLLHYERNSILLGKGFNIAVCRTVDGEVVAALKAQFIVNICECLREVEFLQLGAVTEGANASQFLEVLAEDDLLSRSNGKRNF